MENGHYREDEFEGKLTHWLSLLSVEALVELYELTFMGVISLDEFQAIMRRRLRTVLSMRDMKRYAAWVESGEEQPRRFFEDLWQGGLLWTDEQMWFNGQPITMRNILADTSSWDEVAKADDEQHARFVTYAQMMEFAHVVRFPGFPEYERYMLREDIAALYLGAILDLVQHEEFYGEGSDYRERAAQIARELIECVDEGLLDKDMLRDIPPDVMNDARGPE